MSNVKRALQVAPACGLLAILTACGSGSGSSGSSRSATSTTATATVTQSPSAPSSTSTSSTPSAPMSSSPASSTGSVTSPSSGSSSSATAQGRCATGSLAASVRHVGAAAGSTYYTIALRNTGKSSCTLVGYPGVSLVRGANGTQVGAAAARQPGGSAGTVQVPAGGSTTFSVRVAEAGNYPAAQCRPTTTRGLRIYPPGNKDALFLARSGITGCANSASDLLTVGPVGSSTH